MEWLISRNLLKMEACSFLLDLARICRSNSASLIRWSSTIHTNYRREGWLLAQLSRTKPAPLVMVMTIPWACTSIRDRCLAFLWQGDSGDFLPETRVARARAAEGR